MVTVTVSGLRGGGASLPKRVAEGKCRRELDPVARRCDDAARREGTMDRALEGSPALVREPFLGGPRP
jgi:hypothetical protein